MPNHVISPISSQFFAGVHHWGSFSYIENHQVANKKHLHLSDFHMVPTIKLPKIWSYFFFAKSSNHAAFCFSTMLPYDNNPNARVRGLTKFRSISPETCDARELWKNERFTVQVANSQLFWSEMILGDDLKRAKSGCLFHITFYHVLIFNMLYIYIYTCYLLGHRFFFTISQLKCESSCPSQWSETKCVFYL